MKLLSILFLLLSFNIYSSTELVCNDQNSHSVYALEVLDNFKIKLSPLIKDQSSLSSSPAILRYNEGESNELIQLFEGRNTAGVVVLEMNMDKISNLKSFLTVDIMVYYTGNNTNLLDQKTEFICSLK